MIEKKNGIGSWLGRAGDWVCQDPWELSGRGDRKLCERCTGSEAGGGSSEVDDVLTAY